MAEQEDNVLIGVGAFSLRHFLCGIWGWSQLSVLPLPSD
jgi:hypothetical protein